MLIKGIELNNFGVYSGRHVVDLAPENGGDRNIVVIRGRNGSGKTTIMEALMLALLGSLSLDDRVKKQEFQQYLASRIHQKKAQLVLGLESSLKVDFNFLMMGQPSQFSVLRKWGSERAGLYQELLLSENGNPLLDVGLKERELYLRQMVSPGLAKVMFFDGEQLQHLHTHTHLNEFIAESCKAIFGLHLMELLERDLQTFTSKLRQDSKDFEANGLEQAQQILAHLNSNFQELTQRRSLLLASIQDCEGEISKLETEITTHGRWEVDSVEYLEAEKKRLEQEIAPLRQTIADLCAGLAPFAIAEAWLEKIAARLESERETEKAMYAQDVIEARLRTLKKTGFWSLLEDQLGTEKSSELFTGLRDELLMQSSSQNTPTILHQLTEPERDRVLGWIQAAKTGYPDELKRWSELLAEKEAKLEFLKAQQDTVAKKEDISPLLKSLQESNERLGKEKAALAQCEKEIQALETQLYHADREANRLARVEVEGRNARTQLDLAKRTQYVLQAYAKQLLDEKLRMFGRTLVQKFNELCRKPNYLDHARIDPQSFQVSLYKQERLVEQSFLSAGERQLLAISVLWALREMTRISLPLIIDTPLGRLDSEHRKGMLEVFLPSVSHQVIVLGTDEELNPSAIEAMAPFISHLYEVEYDAESEGSYIQERNIQEVILEGVRL